MGLELIYVTALPVLNKLRYVLAPEGENGLSVRLNSHIAQAHETAALPIVQNQEDKLA